MSRIEIEALIHAPIERVFDLARSIDAHVASTPGTKERPVAGRTSGLIGLHEELARVVVAEFGPSTGRE